MYNRRTEVNLEQQCFTNQMISNILKRNIPLAGQHQIENVKSTCILHGFEFQLHSAKGRDVIHCDAVWHFFDLCNNRCKIKGKLQGFWIRG